MSNEQPMIELPITGGGTKTIAANEIESIVQQHPRLRRSIVTLRSKSRLFVELSNQEVQDLVSRARNKANVQATAEEARDASRSDTKTEAQQAGEPLPKPGTSATNEPAEDPAPHYVAPEEAELPATESTESREATEDTDIPLDETRQANPGSRGINEFEPGTGPGQTTRVVADAPDVPDPTRNPAPVTEQPEPLPGQGTSVDGRVGLEPVAGTAGNPSVTADPGSKNT